MARVVIIGASIRRSISSINMMKCGVSEVFYERVVMNASAIRSWNKDMRCKEQGGHDDL